MTGLASSVLSLVTDGTRSGGAATAVVQPFLESFKEFPPRQKAASFTLDQALQKMESVGSGAGH